MKFNKPNKNNDIGSMGTPRRPERLNDDNESLLNDFEMDFELEDDDYVVD